MENRKDIYNLWIQYTTKVIFHKKKISFIYVCTYLLDKVVFFLFIVFPTTFVADNDKKKNDCAGL